jgi:hypothetical protein
MASKKLFNVLKNGLVEIELNSDAAVVTKSKVKKPEDIQVWRNTTSQTVPGTVILDAPMSIEWNYFEFNILKVGDFGEIGIGLGPSDYNVSVMPGWYPKSIGYHADDGKLYHSSGKGLVFGPMCRHGDTMGCGVDFGGEKQGYVTVWFTKNGDLAGPPQRLLLLENDLYPMIGLSSLNESVSYVGHSCVQPPYKEVQSHDTDERVFPLCTQFKAIYPYDAILPEELTLKPGDIVEVAEGDGVSKQKWAKGRIQHTDKEGLFYADFMAPCLPKKGSRERKTLGYKSAYAGNEVILDSEPEEWFECLICKELAYDPHQTSCCGHTLCLKCAVQWNERSDSCINCRKQPFEFRKDSRAERMIKGISLSCPYYTHGCDWKGALGQLLQHIRQECFFGSKDLKLHDNDIIPCPGCNFTVVETKTGKKFSSSLMERWNLITTHYKTCIGWPMRCTNGCSDTFTRFSLPIHLIEDCPNQIIACEFSAMGCKFQAKRKEVQKHYTEDIAQHMSALLGDYMKVKSRVNELTAENERLVQIVDNLNSKKKWF